MDQLLHHVENLGYGLVDIVQSASYGELLIAFLLVVLIGLKVFELVGQAMRRYL